jgi:hypothetical protein
MRISTYLQIGVPGVQTVGINGKVIEGITWVELETLQKPVESDAIEDWLIELADHYRQLLDDAGVVAG